MEELWKYYGARSETGSRPTVLDEEKPSSDGLRSSRHRLWMKLHRHFSVIKNPAIMMPRPMIMFHQVTPGMG